MNVFLISLSADISKKTGFLSNYCFFLTKNVLQEFPFKGKLSKSFHLMGQPYIYLQWFQRPISADFAKIADFSKNNKAINQYVVTLNKTCQLIIEGKFQIHQKTHHMLEGVVSYGPPAPTPRSLSPSKIGSNIGHENMFR